MSFHTLGLSGRRMDDSITFSNDNRLLPPGDEPVTLDEAKQQIRVTTSVDDTFIENLIVSARESAELYCERVFITQTWQMFFDFLGNVRSSIWWDGVRQGAISSIFPDSLDITRPPLQSISSVTSFNDDDVGTVFNADNYFASIYKGDNPRKGRITLRNGASWPVGTRNADSLQIEFIAGYGSLPENVPRQIRNAILEEVAFRYEHRGDCIDTSIGSSIARGMLTQYKITVGL